MLAIIAVGVISFPKVYEVVFPPRHVGTWEGSNYANQKISFVMKSDKRVFIICDNETVSGPYEIDVNKSPNWIDIYYNYSDAKNAKGIIEFMDKNTFRIQLTDHVAKPRPVAFDQKEQLILRKVE